MPYLDGARAALADGYVSGGTRRNLDWVRPHTDSGTIPDGELLLLADAQTSGGLLVAGEIPGYPVIGELIPARTSPLGHRLRIRVVALQEGQRRRQLQGGRQQAARSVRCRP